MFNFINNRMIFIIFFGLLLTMSGCGNFGFNGKKKNQSTKTAKDRPIQYRQNPQDPNYNNLAKNIAVFPGGAVNGYTSLYLAHKFIEAKGNERFDKLFDQAWGLSAGSINAAMLMNGYTPKEALETFKSEISKVFPKEINQIFKGGVTIGFNFTKSLIKLGDVDDSKGKRLNLYKKLIKENIVFKTEEKPRLVIIASAINPSSTSWEPEPKQGLINNNLPVIYADSGLNFPNTKKLSPTQSFYWYDAIINSSNFQIEKIQNFKLPKAITLFRKSEVPLNNNQKWPVVDGFHNNQTSNNPLPLVIEYLKANQPTTGNQRHKVVVFDNGGPQLDSFNLNTAIGTSKIDVYHIKINHPNFLLDSFDVSPVSFSNRENIVNSAINTPGDAKNAFDTAVTYINTAN